MNLKLIADKYILTLEKKSDFKTIFDYLVQQEFPIFPSEFEIKSNFSIYDTLFLKSVADDDVESIYNLAMVIYQVKLFFKEKNIMNYYPQDVEDSSNFIKKYSSWAEVPCYQRYINKRLKIISDPEYLLIYWSKGFENYDSNAGKLLPAYPKSLLNEYFLPPEIKHVCDLYLLELRIAGPRCSNKPFKTKMEALDFFRTNFTLMHDLVYTKDGYEVLSTIHEISILIDKDYLQSKETRNKCVKMIRQMINKMQDKDFKAHLNRNARVGVYFRGMPNPKILPGCIFNLFFLFYNYYLPKNDLINVTRENGLIIDFVKIMYNKDSEIYEIDYDYKKKQIVKKKIEFLYFEKKVFDKIAVKYGYKRLRNSLIQLMLRFYCSENLNTIIQY